MSGFNLQTNVKSRIFGLDMLRTCAIMFVVIGHGNFLLPTEYSNIIEYICGYDGVSIFFVLSGFLIGRILIKAFQTKKDTKNILLNFWIRRWFRTIPNYFLILIMLMTVNLLFKEGFGFDKTFPLTYFTFTQNLFYASPDFFPESWSLAVEEWFYLLVPLIILIFISLKRSVKTSIFITALSILFVITLFRFYRYNNISEDVLSNFTVNRWDLEFRKQVITRLDSLMYGVIGAFLQFYYREYWLKYKKTLLCLGLFLLIASKFLINSNVSDLYSCVFSFSVTSFAILLLLPFLSDFRGNNAGFTHKSITKISLISYSMYLTHLSVVRVYILRAIPWDIITTNPLIINGIKYFLYWFLTIVLSLIIYKYFEVPIMNLRDNKRMSFLSEK